MRNLQSTNEELTTVNEELQVKSMELAEANTDLQNILKSHGTGRHRDAGERQAQIRGNRKGSGRSRETTAGKMTAPCLRSWHGTIR